MRSNFLVVGATALTLLVAVSMVGMMWRNALTRAGETDAAIPMQAAMATQIERVDRLQATVADSAAEIKRLRLAIERLGAGADPSMAPSVGVSPESAAIAEVETMPDVPVDALEGPFVDWIDPLADEYAREWSQSDWGQSAAEAIEQAIPTHPFFERYGGNFVTDCKETTCRVEWLLPSTDELTERDRAELLSTARYEMLALAATNATDVGQMTTEWALDGPSPRMATVFKRAAPSD